MAGIDWFRWHHGSVNDAKFRLVAKRASASMAEVIAVWAVILEKASCSQNRGSFGKLDHEAIDCDLMMVDGTAERIEIFMQERGLVENGYVCQWEVRQPKRERPEDEPTSTQRSKDHRQREKEKKETMQQHATPCNANQSQETPREEKSREEESIQTSVNQPVEVQTAKPARGSRLPSDWKPSESDLQFCQIERPDLDSQAVADKFRDYWHGVAGAKGCKLDWSATWRNFIRSERGPPQKFQHYESAKDKKRRETVEILTGKRNESNVIDIEPASVALG